jgi:hypothetical protein
VRVVVRMSGDGEEGRSERALIYTIPDPAKEVESIDLSFNDSCAPSGVANTCNISGSKTSCVGKVPPHKFSAP